MRSFSSFFWYANLNRPTFSKAPGRELEKCGWRPRQERVISTLKNLWRIYSHVPAVSNVKQLTLGENLLPLSALKEFLRSFKVKTGSILFESVFLRPGFLFAERYGFQAALNTKALININDVQWANASSMREVKKKKTIKIWIFKKEIYWIVISAANINTANV